MVVVEHDEDTMRAADHIVDFGPGPGVRGGEVVAVGTVGRNRRRKTQRHRRSISPASARSKCQRKRIEREARERDGSSSLLARCSPRSAIVGARHNNLKNIDVEIPLGAFVCVTGVSGSGKSSLVNDILVEALLRDSMGGKGQPGEHDRIDGLEHLDKLIAIDQSPIGRTPRSNPAPTSRSSTRSATSTRNCPSRKPAATSRADSASTSQAAAAKPAKATARTELEMDFLADVWVTCPVCEGHRFNRETLQVLLSKGKRSPRCWRWTCRKRSSTSRTFPPIHHKLSTLHDVGLDYMKLGQPSPTLSGGEAQRQAGPRTGEKMHRPHALPARRADHRPALRRHRTAA